MRDRPLSIDIAAYTSAYMLSPPAGGKDSAPCMAREPSFLVGSPHSADESAYSLAQCFINASAAGSDVWAQSMLQGGASWPPLNSPMAENAEPGEPAQVEDDESAAIRDEPGQALSMTLSSASFTDVSGIPPTLEWTSSGLDGLLSRNTSGLDAVLNAVEDEAEDKAASPFADLYVEEASPAPEQMSVDDQDQLVDNSEEEEECKPTQIFSLYPVVRSVDSPPHSAPASSIHPPPLRLSSASPARFDPFPGVQRTIEKPLYSAPAAPRRRRRRNQQPRGAHVKNRPEMQETAREGQKHWGNMVQELRRQWQERQVWEHSEAFREQIQMCSRTHIKSQHECLLRQLQIALVDQIVTASDFSPCEEDSFLGWTGFQIVPEHKDEFRARIENMFASIPKENTLNNAFRRAGLVPKQCWNEAWKGKAAFFYDGTKRATYTQPQPQP